MPIGVLRKAQKNTINKLPMIALASPPPGVPGAGEISKNNAGLIAENPLNKRIAKIHNKNIIPIDMATRENVKPNKLARLRLANKVGSREIIMFLLLDLLPFASA
jgi:hypothetical protein